MALDAAAGFKVAAGEVHVAAVGSWSKLGSDTGGEGCDCHAARDLVLCSGHVLEIDLDLVCANAAWTDGAGPNRRTIPGAGPVNPRALLLAVISLLTGCTHGYALATLNVTPVVQGAVDIELCLDVTKSDHNGSDTKGAAPGEVTTFMVAAGEVHLALSGSGYDPRGDTGGDVYDCSGEGDVRVRWGRVYDVEIEVECRYLFTDD